MDNLKTNHILLLNGLKPPQNSVKSLNRKWFTTKNCRLSSHSMDPMKKESAIIKKNGSHDIQLFSTWFHFSYSNSFTIKCNKDRTNTIVTHWMNEHCLSMARSTSQYDYQQLNNNNNNNQNRKRNITQNKHFSGNKPFDSSRYTYNIVSIEHWTLKIDTKCYYLL